MSADHLHGVDLNLLVALDALLAEGSVTGAARRSGVTQSAMSHSLAKLRTLLGDELLVRTRLGMSPTARARSLAQPLARALAELRSVVSSGSTFDPAASRRSFTIATADYGSFVLLPRLMARLGREAPGVEIFIRPVPAALVGPLEDERIDVALLPSPEAGAALVAQRLFTERFVCLVRRKHPAVGEAQRRLDLDTFTRLSHVQIAPRGTRGGAVDELLAGLGRSRHVALRVPDFLVAPLVVAGSDLVLTVPERIARVFAGTHDLRIVESPLDVPTFGIWQIWHARRKQEPAHAWLRGLLAKVVQDEGAPSRAPKRAKGAERRATGAGQFPQPRARI